MQFSEKNLDIIVWKNSDFRRWGTTWRQEQRIKDHFTSFVREYIWSNLSLTCWHNVLNKWKFSSKTASHFQKWFEWKKDALDMLQQNIVMTVKRLNNRNVPCYLWEWNHKWHKNECPWVTWKCFSLFVVVRVCPQINCLNRSYRITTYFSRSSLIKYCCHYHLKNGVTHLKQRIIVHKPRDKVCNIGKILKN